MSPEVVYARIDELRDERNWSDYELAKRSKLDVSTLYKGRNNSVPDVNTLEQLCEAFGISLGEFFMFTGKVRKDHLITDKEYVLIETNRQLKGGLQKRAKEYMDDLLRLQIDGLIKSEE